jgi:Mce-associated membrane protein
MPAVSSNSEHNQVAEPAAAAQGDSASPAEVAQPEAEPDSGPDLLASLAQGEADPEPSASADGAAETDVPAERDQDAEAGPRRSRAARRRTGVALLGGATILLGSFGIWATASASSLRSSAATANGALVDRGATSALTRDITRAVDTIFTYSYSDTARTRAAAQHLLVGHAIRQYDQLFALVEREAPKEKLVVTTKVTDIGVELLSNGRARVLVFANQQDSRAGTSQASYGGAMFAVTALYRHGAWVIENIDTFTSPAR